MTGVKLAHRHGNPGNMWVAGQATLGKFIVHSNIVAGNTEKHRVIPSFSKNTSSECKKRAFLKRKIDQMLQNP